MTDLGMTKSLEQWERTSVHAADAITAVRASWQTQQRLLADTELNLKNQCVETAAARMRSRQLEQELETVEHGRAGNLSLVDDYKKAQESQLRAIDDLERSLELERRSAVGLQGLAAQLKQERDSERDAAASRIAALETLLQQAQDWSKDLEGGKAQAEARSVQHQKSLRALHLEYSKQAQALALATRRYEVLERDVVQWKGCLARRDEALSSTQVDLATAIAERDEARKARAEPICGECVRWDPQGQVLGQGRCDKTLGLDLGTISAFRPVSECQNPDGFCPKCPPAAKAKRPPVPAIPPLERSVECFECGRRFPTYEALRSHQGHHKEEA